MVILGLLPVKGAEVVVVAPMLLIVRLLWWLQLTELGFDGLLSKPIALVLLGCFSPLLKAFGGVNIDADVAESVQKASCKEAEVQQIVKICIGSMSKSFEGGNVSRAKPAPSQTPVKASTSPIMPALKPSYSQVTKMGTRACDPEKHHVTGARDRPHDLQVLWGSHDLAAHDPGKGTCDPLGDKPSTRSGDPRYVTCSFIQPAGTINECIRINKVV